MRNTKKLAALLIVALMLVSALIGCAQPAAVEPAAEPAAPEAAKPAEETAPAAADEKITIRMIDSLASENRTAAIQAIIDKYQAANPNVTVELISPPTDGADQKIQQMLLAGEPLDIIDTGNAFQVCLNNGWVQPLNQYIANWDEMGTITGAAKTRMTLYAQGGDEIWLIPYGIYQMLLFYRTDRLAEAGVEVPDVWTWENIYEIATKCTDKAAGKYGWSFRGGARGQSVYDYLMLAHIGDDVLLNNEAYRAFTKDGGIVYRTPEAKTALEFYKKLYTECSPADAIAWGFTEMVQGFMSGTCALLLQDNDVIQSCESGLDRSLWDVGNVPIGPSGSGTQSCGFGGWAMTASCEHPQETADFMMFLSNAENNGYFCEKTGLLPIHTTTIETNDYFSSGVYTVFNEMNELSYRIYQNLGIGYTLAATFGNDRDEQLQKYMIGELEADDLLNHWAEQWEKAVAEEGELWK